MKLEEAKKCSQCGGHGSFRSLDPQNDDIPCEFCEDGLEKDQNLVLEKFLGDMDKAEEEKLQDHFMSLREIGGMPITKDNCEDLFETWLSKQTLSDLENILHG